MAVSIGAAVVAGAVATKTVVDVKQNKKANELQEKALAQQAERDKKFDEATKKELENIEKQTKMAEEKAAKETAEGKKLDDLKKTEQLTSEQIAAKERQTRKAKRGVSRQDTILTSPLGVTDKGAPTARKTLLGA